MILSKIFISIDMVTVLIAISIFRKKNRKLKKYS